ncbi:iron chelate uptake ABC transporter family permease subunit [Conexibacter sp. W3-3-2]|uniref:FecCD family ABC transporter permease n=1 Tax=Conexibacter sp. W3-3-2 TaxID=2675227 RepID=UPI0012B82551|nr:iron ABC transporter permease [Conexibacter sp. W3-3-2]MTD44770.1 iron chelate uptake ABC transporter family permease subunit [Conexibacter sp. W3-3-2]
MSTVVARPPASTSGPAPDATPARRRRLRRAAVVAVAFAVLVGATAASLAFGAVDVPLGTVLDALLGRAQEGPLKEIVLQLRLPRTVEALTVGAALGVAGAMLQGALANPLASPEVLGVTAGSGFGAVLVLLAFPTAVALLPVGALAFGALAIVLVMAFAWGGRGGGSTQRLILAGIAVSAMFGAGTTSLMVAFSDRVQGAVLFLAGGFSSDGWEGMDVAWPFFLAGFALALVLCGPLDRLALGDDVAASLGSRPRLVRLGAAVAAAFLASASAAIAGLLGFVGLVVPHLVRLVAGTARHRYVVPVSAAIGAGLVLTADTMARIVVAPIELPVGPIMVLLGVPLFLVLLRRET